MAAPDTAAVDAPRQEPETEQPKPQATSHRCYLCGEEDSWFRVGSKYFCSRSCAEAYCC